MKTKLKTINSTISKSFRIFKNISRNATKEIFNNKKIKKITDFIKEYKFYFIIIFIVILFIAKNIYTIHSYNKEIELYKERIVREKSLNEQLKEDLAYYKTDTYIIKVATEELNLRLTTENRLYHGPIFSYIPEAETTDNVEESFDEETESQEIEDNIDSDKEKNDNNEQ